MVNEKKDEACEAACKFCEECEDFCYEPWADEDDFDDEDVEYCAECDAYCELCYSCDPEYELDEGEEVEEVE